MNYQLQTTISEDKAKSLLRDEREQGVSAIRFTKVNLYTTFDAEYGFVDRDIVFHFFLPDALDITKAGQLYWTTTFPAALDSCAQEFWGVGAPRLKAAFTEELNSWWLRCFGFGVTGDPVASTERFLEKLDQWIEKSRG